MTDRLLQGIGVSPGVAFGPAVIVRLDVPDVPNRFIGDDEVDSELTRLKLAVAGVAELLAALRDRVRERAGREESHIFDAQIMMAEDPDFLRQVEQCIRDGMSAETAYEFKALELRNTWSASGNALLRDRLADLSAIHNRMLHRLLGRTEEELWSLPEGSEVVIVARELSPGLTVQLDRDRVVGLLSEEGTRTSHAAILAHSLGIPAVMGAVGALDRIRQGTVLLLDGQTGTILLDPNRAEIERARAQLSRRQKLEFELEAAVTQAAITPDGVQLTVMGNVDLPDEIAAAVRLDAQGVGLLRTEFLVTGRAHLPTEDEQADYFRRVCEAFPEHPVVIRSFDLGGDKFPAAFRAPQEANPFLGWRSIRVCLDHPEIFRPQLRAVLRAAADRKIQLMLPLVTQVDEVIQAREMLLEEALKLARNGVRAAASVPVGVMIETPAAAILADQFAQHSAFFSVGTNDLVQYTLAVDRGNARLADRFTPHHPAVVRQLKGIVMAGQQAGIGVSVCGEMAADPLSVVLLIGLGYRCLSVGPPAIPLVKWVVRTVPVAVAEAAAAAALAADRPAEVTAALRDAVKDRFDPRVFESLAALPRPSGPATLRS
ncbi:MAG: phosphoenolpyruvate--protein phosphotransferase [Gemmatimonadetes bacterium]|nr:phosphoenolpyruvate--protein phosphotransferase [Gemmatimonadota bacterium]MBK7783493.1 phosphoenolpyruvate--protein phosphotransferase [Gemmatimonadota bacterium]MBK9068459.1 phosphoenolpyruvate--protein phosphotransferase [Gemmatimonadota bacterium]